MEEDRCRVCEQSVTNSRNHRALFSAAGKAEALVERFNNRLVAGTQPLSIILKMSACRDLLAGPASPS